MQLETLIKNLERWAADMDRERWQDGSQGREYDCEMVELCDLLRESAKELKQSAPNR